MYEPNRISTRRMEAYIPDRPDTCVPSPGDPGDSAAPVQYGIVEGWIFRQDGGRPLAGANLVLVVGQTVCSEDVHRQKRSGWLGL